MAPADDGAGDGTGARWGQEGTRETEPVLDPRGVDARAAERWEAPAATAHPGNDGRCAATGNGEDAAADDDSWCDASDSPGHESSLHREWTHRQDQFHKMGYRDGITEGQKDVAQEGFNLGHRQSAHVGYNALATLPDSLKEKLLRDAQHRGKLEDLHNFVLEISAQSALQLFHDSTLQDNCRPEDSKLQTITKDLLLLLHECPDVHVSGELK